MRPADRTKVKAPARSRRPSVPLPSASPRGRILVCETESMVGRRVAQRLLEDGLDMERASTAAEALARVSSGAVDLVVCDRGLADGDGLDVCRAIKEDAGTHHVPVVVLCTPDDLAGRIAASEAGADDVFSRTVAPEELAARLHALLRTYLFNRDIWESRCGLKSEVDRFQGSAERLAHDMRNSLAATLGDMEFVRSRLGQVEPEVLEAADDVLRSLRHLERLTLSMFERR